MSLGTRREGGTEIRTKRRSIVPALVVFAMGVVALVPAGATTMRWSREVGRGMQAVAVDAHGNGYVAGQTQVPDRNATGALLARFGPDGRLQWTHTYLPSGSFGAYGTAVTVAPDGSVVWGGKVWGPCEGGGWFLQRVSPTGRILWTRSEDGWRECEVATALTDIAIAGGSIVTAMYDHGCCGDTMADAFLQAFGMGGAMTWTRDLEPPGVWKGFYETATSLAAGRLDNVYVAGWAATKLKPGEFVVPGFVFVQKLSSGGGLVWHRRIEASWSRETDAGVAVRGDAVLVASRLGRKGKAYLTRFTVGGDRRWTTRWSPDPRFGSTPHSVSIDATGTSWVVGRREDPGNDHANAFIRTFSPGGGVTSARVIDATRWLEATGVDAWGGGFALVSGTNIRTSADHGRVWALRS